MASFYTIDCKWEVNTDPVADREDWLFPDHDQHFRETSNPEDLFVKPEDIDILPEEVQAGQIQWSFDPGFQVFEERKVWGFFYAPPDKFYAVEAPGFDFYNSPFYVFELHGLEHWGFFYAPPDGFYPNAVPTFDFYNQFYIVDISFGFDRLQWDFFYAPQDEFYPVKLPSFDFYMSPFYIFGLDGCE